MKLNLTKEVPGFEGLYFVDILGNVFSHDRVCKNRRGDYIKSGKKLKPYKGNHGYFIYSLYRDKKHYKMLGHKIVMSAFVGEDNGLDVNHKNGDRTDNRLINLEYLTRQENQIHSHKYLPKKIQKHQIQVLACDIYGNTKYKSIREASKLLKIDARKIKRNLDSNVEIAGIYFFTSK